MTKSRASLKGRGADILLGGSPAEPEPETPAAQPAPEAAETKPFAEAEPESLSAVPNPFAQPEPVTAAAPNPFAEPEPAEAAVPRSSAETAPAPTEPEPFAEPAVDDTSFQSELASGQPPEPVSTSLPPEESAWLADAPLPIPDTPAAETASSAGGPVSVSLPADQTLLKPAMIGGVSMGIPIIPGSESYEPPTGVTHTGLRAVGIGEVRPTASDAEVLKRIGAERARALSKRIDELYALIASGAISNSERAGDALSNLRTARDKELEDPRQFDEAEYLVNVAQYMVSHEASIAQVRQWSYTWGVVVFIYGLFWLAAFLAGLGLVILGLVQSWLITLNLQPDIVAAASGLFASIMAGGLGGVLGLYYSLFKHVAVEQDFDRQFLLWYFVQPYMGILMGVIVNLFVVAGLFQLLDATGPAFQAIGALIALAAAFRQHYVYAWLESLLKAFERRSEQIKAKGQAASTVPAAAAEPARAEVEARAGAASPPQPFVVTTPAGEGEEPAGVG